MIRGMTSVLQPCSPDDATGTFTYLPRFVVEIQFNLLLIRIFPGVQRLEGREFLGDTSPAHSTDQGSFAKCPGQTSHRRGLGCMMRTWNGDGSRRTVSEAGCSWGRREYLCVLCCVFPKEIKSAVCSLRCSRDKVTRIFSGRDLRTVRRRRTRLCSRVYRRGPPRIGNGHVVQRRCPRGQIRAGRRCGCAVPKGEFRPGLVRWGVWVKSTRSIPRR